MLKNSNHIKDLESYSLSDKDVLKIVDGKANFITYDQLKYVDSIDELLEPYGSCIILYLTEPNYGHFVSLNLVGPNEDVLEHFDSYGIIPDDELREFNISKEVRDEYNEDYPYLLQLMYDSPYELSFNEHKLQARKNNINTCGRWAAMRSLLRHLPLEEFVDIFQNNKLGTPDEIVTAITQDIGNY
jgi:hypothetical protein